jgi:hypothetical protein
MHDIGFQNINSLVASHFLSNMVYQMTQTAHKYCRVRRMYVYPEGWRILAASSHAALCGRLVSLQGKGEAVGIMLGYQIEALPWHQMHLLHALHCLLPCGPLPIFKKSISHALLLSEPGVGR